MGGMGNQDGGDEDFSLKDEEIVKKRREKKQKTRRGSWGRWGDGEVFVCDGEQERPRTHKFDGRSWGEVCSGVCIVVG